MMGRLHLDLLFQNRCLLNGVEVRLQLICSKGNFCLQSNATLIDCEVSLKEATLFVLKVKTNPSIQLAHAKTLKQATAKYPLRRIEIKSFANTNWKPKCCKKICFVVNCQNKSWLD